VFRWIFERTLKKTFGSCGVGPFSPIGLAALFASRCVRCRDQIPYYSLIGNALFVSGPRQVEPLCCRCRGAGGHLPHYVRQVVLPLWEPEILLSWGTQRGRYGEPLDWLDLLNSMRLGLAYLGNAGMRGPNPADAFQSKQWGDFYGKVRALSHCAECGALWRDPSVQEKWNDEMCWHCNIPHHHQWNMRISLESERALLMRPPETASTRLEFR